MARRTVTFWAAVAALLTSARGPCRAGRESKGAVVLSFKVGCSDTLAPDAKSQTVLLVNVNPNAPAWGTKLDVQSGRFSVRVTWYGKGKLAPRRVENAKFPLAITVTSWKLPDGVHTQRSAAIVYVTYTPPGDRTGRRAKTCKATAHITVTSKTKKPPASKPNKYIQLRSAIRAGNTAAVEKLLADGVSANVRYRPSGWWPLHYAVVCTPSGVSGARPPKGVPPATVRTRCKLIELLLAAGAYVNGRDNQLATPLHLAAVKGQTTDVVRLLLDNGADPWAKMRAFRDPKSAATVTPAEAAGQAPPPWNQQIRRLLRDAVADKGWKPAQEYANCHGYTIYLATGRHLRKPVNDLQVPRLDRELRGVGYLPLAHRSRLAKLDDPAILAKLRDGDVLVIGRRHSATVRKTAQGLRFWHFAGQTTYDAGGRALARSDLGPFTIDRKTGKRTYRKPGSGAVAGAAPGAKKYEVHCSARGGIAAMSRGIKPWGKDPVVIYRRLGQYQRGSWYLVADATQFRSTSSAGHSESAVRTLSSRFEVAGKFEDRTGKAGITFEGSAKAADAKTGAARDGTMKAVFDDAMTKLVSLEIRFEVVAPDRGAIKGSRTEMVLRAKDIEVRRVGSSSIFCRTAAPGKRITQIKHETRRGRWTTTVEKVASKKVGWLEIKLDEPKPPAGP